MNDRKLKILNITLLPVYPPNYGGAIVFFNISLELARRGHEVSFLTIKENGVNYSEFDSIFKHNIYISKKNRLAALLSWIPYTCRRFAPNAKEKKAILHQIKTIEYDVIIFHNPYSALYYYFLKDVINTNNISVAYFSHNIESEYHLNNSKTTLSFKRKIFYYLEYLKLSFFEKRFIKNFKLIFTVSPEDMKKLKIMHPKSDIVWVKPIIIMIDNNLGSLNCLYESLASTINHFKHRILFTGHLAHADNIFAVLWFTEYVLPILLRNDINFCLIIVGKNPTKEIFELQNKYHNIYVFANVDSVAPYYNAADLVVIPLFNNAGVKIKLIEALKFKKKVVSRPEGVYGSGLSDIIPTADTPEDFAQKCIDVLEGKIDFGPIWKKFNEIYDNEKIIDKLEYELLNLVDKTNDIRKI